MLKYVAMGIAAAAGIGAGLYLKKKKDEKAEADIRHFEENLDRIAAECSPFNDEKWAAEFQENLQKCVDDEFGRLNEWYAKYLGDQYAEMNAALDNA